MQCKLCVQRGVQNPRSVASLDKICPSCDRWKRRQIPTAPTVQNKLAAAERQKRRSETQVLGFLFVIINSIQKKAQQKPINHQVAKPIKVSQRYATAFFIEVVKTVQWEQFVSEHLVRKPHDIKGWCKSSSFEMNRNRGFIVHSLRFQFISKAN